MPYPISAERAQRICIEIDYKLMRGAALGGGTLLYMGKLPILTILVIF